MPAFAHQRVDAFLGADAKLAIQTAVRVVQGEEVPKVQYIPTPKVNASNIDEFERPTW